MDVVETKGAADTDAPSESATAVPAAVALSTASIAAGATGAFSGSGAAAPSTAADGVPEMAATDTLDASGNGGAGVAPMDTAADAAGASGIAATLSIAPTPGAISGVLVGTLGATMATGAVDTMAGSAETDATGVAVTLKRGVSDVTGLTDAVATEPTARSARVVVDDGRSVFTRLDCCASWTSAPVACWRFRSATSTVAFATALAWPECSEVMTSSESPTFDEEAPGAPYLIGAIGAFEAGAGVDEAMEREGLTTATT